MRVLAPYDPRDVFTLQEVLASESRERGSRKTIQEVLDEMVRDPLRQALRQTAERRRPQGIAVWVRPGRPITAAVPSGIIRQSDMSHSDAKRLLSRRK